MFIVDTNIWLELLLGQENTEQTIAMNENSMAGLIDSSIIIRRETEKSSPITPLATGNLRASWFVVTAFERPPQDPYSGRFKGEDKGEMSSEHASTKSKYGSEAKASPIPFLIMGYSANYAVYVHENVEHFFKRPQSGPKWFQLALQDNAKNIIKVIGKKTKIK